MRSIARLDIAKQDRRSRAVIMIYALQIQNIGWTTNIHLLFINYDSWFLTVKHTNLSHATLHYKVHVQHLQRKTWWISQSVQRVENAIADQSINDIAAYCHVSRPAGNYKKCFMGCRDRTHAQVLTKLKNLHAWLCSTCIHAMSKTSILSIP